MGYQMIRIPDDAYIKKCAFIRTFYLALSDVNFNMYMSIRKDATRLERSVVHLLKQGLNYSTVCNSMYGENVRFEEFDNYDNKCPKCVSVLNEVADND